MTTLALGTPLGLAIFSYVSFALGMLGLLNRRAGLAVLGVLAWATLAGISHWWHMWRRGPLFPATSELPSGSAPPGTPAASRRIWSLCGWPIIAFCALMYLAPALAPLYGADSVRHHFAVAKIVALRGGIEFLPVLYFNAPQNMEMLFSLGLLLHKDTVGLLINYSMGLLAMTAVFVLARDSHRPSAPLAAAVFYAMPIVIFNSAAIANDFGPLLYTLPSFHAFLQWQRETEKRHEARATRWLVLSGIYAGLSAATKYTGAYTPLVLGVLVTACRRPGVQTRHWPSVGGSPARRSFFYHRTVVFVLAAIVAGCPWYLRNLIVTGNPVWPLLYPYLGGRDWNMDAHRAVMEKVIYSVFGPTPGGSLPRLFLVLIEPDPAFPRGGAGPFFLAFVPLIFMLGRAMIVHHLWILLFVASFFVVWVAGSQYGRFFLPAVALLSVVVASVADALAQGRKLQRRACAVALVLGFGIQLPLAAVFASNFTGVIFGVESRDHFLRRATSLYEDVVWMNRNLPADAVVFDTTGSSLYYLERKYVWGNYFQGFVDYGQLTTATRLASRLKELGVTHVFTGLVNTDARLSPKDDQFVEMMAELLREHARCVYHNPTGHWVSSLTLSQYVRGPVWVFEIADGGAGRGSQPHGLQSPSWGRSPSGRSSAPTPECEPLEKRQRQEDETGSEVKR